MPTAKRKPKRRASTKGPSPKKKKISQGGGSGAFSILSKQKKTPWGKKKTKGK